MPYLTYLVLTLFLRMSIFDALCLASRVTQPDGLTVLDTTNPINTTQADGLEAYGRCLHHQTTRDPSISQNMTNQPK